MTVVCLLLLWAQATPRLLGQRILQPRGQCALERFPALGIVCGLDLSRSKIIQTAGVQRGLLRALLQEPYRRRIIFLLELNLAQDALELGIIRERPSGARTQFVGLGEI